MFVKYSMMAFLLIVYINRGLFVVSAIEIETQGKGEINSVVEWLLQLITGENNDIDEDGDIQSDYNFVKTAGLVFFQECTQHFDLLSICSKNTEKIAFPNQEDFRQRDFYTKIDHPPQIR